MSDKKTPSAVPTVLKSWAIGATIGLAVGSGLGLTLGHFYDAGNLVSVFIIVGLIAGSYYGSVVGYSNFRKEHKLGL